MFSPGVVPGVGMMLAALLKDGGAMCLLHPEYPPFEQLAVDSGYKVNFAHMVLRDMRYEIDWALLEEQLS